MKKIFIFFLILGLACNNSNKVSDSTIDYFYPACFEGEGNYSEDITLPDSLCNKSTSGVVYVSFSYDTSGKFINIRLPKIYLKQHNKIVMDYFDISKDKELPDSVIPFYNYFFLYKDSIKIHIKKAIKCEDTIFFDNIFYINNPTRELINRAMK